MSLNFKDYLKSFQKNDLSAKKTFEGMSVRTKTEWILYLTLLSTPKKLWINKVNGSNKFHSS